MSKPSDRALVARLTVALPAIRDLVLSPMFDDLPALIRQHGTTPDEYPRSGGLSSLGSGQMSDPTANAATTLVDTDRRDRHGVRQPGIRDRTPLELNRAAVILLAVHSQLVTAQASLAQVSNPHSTVPGYKGTSLCNACGLKPVHAPTGRILMCEGCTKAWRRLDPPEPRTPDGAPDYQRVRVARRNATTRTTPTRGAS